jgi:hypothetical protein
MRLRRPTVVSECGVEDGAERLRRHNVGGTGAEAYHPVFAVVAEEFEVISVEGTTSVLI